MQRQTQTLRGLLVDNGDTVREVARALKITPEVLSRKLYGKSDFKQREIAALIRRYDLPPEDTYWLFFGIELNPKLENENHTT